MLTESKKADRVKMAKAVEALCNQYSATFKREDSEREIDMEIVTHRGLAVRIDLNGKGNNVFCMPWHFNRTSDACMSEAFGDAMNSKVNQFHFHKCTAFAYSWGALMLMLERGLAMAKDGTAFDAQREALSISKNGTAAQQNAKWATYFAEQQSSHPTA